MGLLALASLYGCARSHPPDGQVSGNCRMLSQAMANQENSFVARVQGIRRTHILLLDYDKQMIALITERRQAIQSQVLAGESADAGVAGCSGQKLQDLRLAAEQQMFQLEGFLNTFRRGLQEDPQGVFIDQR